MTPADQLKYALRQAKQAIDRMEGEGIAETTLDDVISRLADLTYAAAELPDQIFSLEQRRCASCEWYQQNEDLEPCGDGTALRVAYECTASNSLDCPAVKAVGFIDENDPIAVVSRFLHLQQAE